MLLSGPSSLQDLHLVKVALAVLTAFVLFSWCWRPRLEDSSKSTELERQPTMDPKLSPLIGQADDEPHVNIVNAVPTWPRNVVYRNNASQACPFDSGVCHGAFLALHKPTYDAGLNSEGNYPYADHMHKRKRLWEFRLQMQFRQPVEGQIFVGVEQYDYQKVGAAQQNVANILIRALQRATGGLYQSYGDDPETTKGEVERPHMVFPISTMMDQLIVTPKGEAPPVLTDPRFPTLGLTKANDRSRFKKSIEMLELVPGPTFTFGFWGIAQFLDTILWSAPPRGMMPEIKLKKIGIIPPGFMVMYSLQDKKEEFVSPQSSPRESLSRRGENSRSATVPPVPGKVLDGRHLDSRKVYLWRTAFWSTIVPPDPKRLKDILADCVKEEARRTNNKKKPATVRNRWCCGI